MKNKETQKQKETYTKPEVFTHEPLRNITANGPDVMPTPRTPTPGGGI